MAIGATAGKYIGRKSVSFVNQGGRLEEKKEKDSVGVNGNAEMP